MGILNVLQWKTFIEGMTLTMIVIAFGHEKSVGKDTAAKFLTTILRTSKPGITINKIGFASKLKAICYDLYQHLGLKDEQYYEDNPPLKEIILPKLGKSPRTIWIEMGNKVREVYPGTWLEYPFNRIKADILIFKDLRFWNEAEKVEFVNDKYKGYNIKIENDRIPHTSDEADDNLLNFDRWYKVIKNNGTIGDLYKEMEILVKELGLI